MDQANYIPPFIEAKRRNGFPWKFFIIFILLLLLIPLSIGMVQVYQNFSLPTVSPTPVPTTIAFPTDTPTPTIAPTITPLPSPTPKGSTVDARSGLDKSKITVLVENGSGKAGAATKASQILKLAGYTILNTKNADSYDYLDITISIKPDKAAYLPLLKQDLSTVYTIADTKTTLEASSSADAIVIVGR
jgi:hypothetical protein